MSLSTTAKIFASTGLVIIGISSLTYSHLVIILEGAEAVRPAPPGLLVSLRESTPLDFESELKPKFRPRGQSGGGGGSMSIEMISVLKNDWIAMEGKLIRAEKYGDEAFTKYQKLAVYTQKQQVEFEHFRDKARKLESDLKNQKLITEYEKELAVYEAKEKASKIKLDSSTIFGISAALLGWFTTITTFVLASRKDKRERLELEAKLQELRGLETA